MLKSNYFVAPCALLALAALGGGCGDDNGGGGATTGGGNGDGGTNGGGETVDVRLAVVPITATDDSNRFKQPHEVLLLDSATGESIPGLPASVTSSDGYIEVDGVPADITPSLWVIGNPEAGTYDTVSTSPHGTGETLLYVSSQGTADTVASVAKFELKPDRAAVTGTVYFTPGGPGNPRMGTVACAKIFLDDKQTGLDTETDQRYVATQLPVPQEELDETTEQGTFYFANMTPGVHTLKVTLDDGATFIAEQEVNVRAVRSEAMGPTKNMLFTIGIDSEVEQLDSCTR